MLECIPIHVLLLPACQATSARYKVMAAMSSGLQQNYSMLYNYTYVDAQQHKVTS